MNANRLCELLNECSGQFRKGPTKEQRETSGLQVTEYYFMPHDSEARDDLEMVDVEFVQIGVDKPKAEEHRAEIIALLNDWPDPTRLAGGPSYIEVGGVVGDQGMALQLFGVGQALGLWKVITPTSMGFSGEEARQMAGSGFVMMTGYHRQSEPA